ncbi:MAG: hypothetical protein EA416_08295 [Trueperaceae bacterium]|nr:MAG: hypothetical protein EA416_08295 [Trueperaceae bacterium]
MCHQDVRTIARQQRIAVIACCSLVLALAAGLASARVDSVTIDRVEPFEKAGGYTYVEATMHGTVEREDGSVGGVRRPPRPHLP